MKIRRLFILIALLVGTLVQSFAISTPVNAAAHLLGNYLCADGTTFVAEECPALSYDAAGASSAGVILIPKGSTCYDINGINTMPCDYDMRNDVGKFGELVFSKYENDYKAKHGRLPTPSELVSFINEIAFAQLDNNNPTDDWENKDCSKLSGVDNIQCVAIQKCIKDGVGNQTQCVSAWENCIGTVADPAHPTEAEAKTCAEKITKTGASEGDEAETCAIDGVGWILCPLVGFLGKVNDTAYATVEKMLVFTLPHPFSTKAEENPIYTIWSNIRNVANVLFVIAFFAVIFSQATSFGISAYGIRKMLPRIIIAAILVNLSYYICVFAIDVSNIVGAGFDGLLEASVGGAATSHNGSWEKVGSTVLVAGGSLWLGIPMAAAFIYFATGLFLALAAGALLAIITTLVILLIRHVLLILCIVLAPLALAAYILPNTEGLFDKWRKTFTSLLIMYPLIALLFAGTKVASDIIMMTHSGDAQTGGKMDSFYMLMALAVLFIPLFGIPWIVKFSGGAMARFAGVMNNRNRGLIDRAGKIGKERSAVNRKEFMARAASGSLKNMGWKTDAEGNRIGKERGLKGFLGRHTVGRSGRTRVTGAAGDKARDVVQRAARRSMDGKWEREQRTREAEFAIHHDRIDRLSETEEEIQRDANGNIMYQKEADGTDKLDASGEKIPIVIKRPTASAEKMRLRAAGVGGAAGAGRIERLVNEEKRKEFVDDIKRANADHLNAGLFNHGTEVYELDAQGNRVGEALAMHERLGAVASGHSIEWESPDGKVYRIDGKDSVQRYAAISRMEETQDKKAAAAMYFSDQVAAKTLADFGGDQVKFDAYLQAREKQIRFTVHDPEYRAEVERAIGSAAGLGAAFPELRKSKPGAYNNTNAQVVSQFSGESVQLAYQYFAEQAATLRAQEAAAQASGDAVQLQTVRNAIAANDTAKARFKQSFIQALQNPNTATSFDPGALNAFQAENSDLNVQEMLRGTSNAPTTKIDLTTNPATAGSPPVIRTAASIRSDIAGLGGIDKLSNDEAYDMYQHSLNNSAAMGAESGALLADLTADLRRRGIIP